MSRRLLFAIVVASLCVSHATAMADVIILNTGVEKEGVILQEDENEIKLQTKLGTTGFPRDLIESIVRVSEKENDQLLLRWDREKELRERAKVERVKRLRAFEAEQKAKGLVKYKDEWMTPTEAEARLRADLAQRKLEASEAGTVPPEETESVEEGKEEEEEQAAPEDPLLQFISVTASVPKRSSTLPEFPVRCRIVNSAFRDAASVTIRLIAYDNDGQELTTVETRSRSVAAGGRSTLQVVIEARLGDVAAITADVVDVQWR